MKKTTVGAWTGNKDKRGHTPKRIFHTWDKWECYPAGFYEDHPPRGMSTTQALEEYASFLRDIPRFEAALERVLSEWKHSCEHYLTNVNMNRIAWLGQAAMCIDTGVPACFRGGYNKLTDEEKAAADETALRYLNLWLLQNAEPPLQRDEAASRTKADLY